MSFQPRFETVNDAAQHLRQRALWIGDKLIFNSGKLYDDSDDGDLEYKSVKVIDSIL
jgi:hypothetical protein